MSDTQRLRPKRPNRSGSLHTYRHTVKGTVYIRWRATGYFTPPNGEPKKILGTGTTAEAATAKLQHNITKEQVAYGLLGREALELPASSKKRLVADVLEEWLKDRKNDPKLRLNSFKGYEAKVRIYLLPHLGSIPVRFLDYDILHTFVWDTLLNIKDGNGDPHLGTTSHRGVYNVLQLALIYAVDRRFIDANPMAGVRAPQKNKRTKDDLQIFRELAETVPQDVMNAVHQQAPDELRWLLAFHGLRQGEVLGLTDDCIRWSYNDPKFGDPESIIIKQQLDRISFTHGCGDYDALTRTWACGTFADQCPKVIGDGRQIIRYEAKSTAGDRELPLNGELKAALIRHLKWRDGLRTKAQFVPLSGERMDSLIFVKANGHPIRAQDDRRDWSKVLKLAGVTHPLRVHDARHLAATLAVNNEMPSDTMARIFGWSPRHAQEMIRLYAHPSPSILQSGMDILGDRLYDRINVTPEEHETIRDLIEVGYDADLIAFELTKRRVEAIPERVHANAEAYRRALKKAQVGTKMISSIMASMPTETP